LWRERYHARELTTPRSVRNALVYVLMNAKKHGYRFASGIDPLGAGSCVQTNGLARPIECRKSSAASVGRARKRCPMKPREHFVDAPSFRAHE
jgi:hypothetical protein